MSMYGSPCKKMSIYFVLELKLEGNLLCCACALAYVRALMMRKSCAVGMRNAILRNHLNGVIWDDTT